MINMIAARYMLVGVLYFVMGRKSFAFWALDAHFAEFILPYWLMTIGTIGFVSCWRGNAKLATTFAVCVLIHSIYRVVLLCISGNYLEPLICLFAVEAIAMVWLIRRLQQWKVLKEWQSKQCF